MNLFGSPAGYRFRPMRRPAPARARPLLGPDFPGGRFPIGSPVSFVNEGRTYRGSVTALLLRMAKVEQAGGDRWRVSYGLLRREEGAPEPRCSLIEADRMGRELIRHHTETGELEPGWEFGFNLDVARGGVCRFDEHRIELSVTYCHRENPEGVQNSILHEVTHAIVGRNHGHDPIWSATNLRLGGDGKRCHEVEHTPPRWMGRCGCGSQFPRHRLSRRTRTGICPKCRGRIRWERHVGGFVGNGATGDPEPRES